MNKLIISAFCLGITSGMPFSIIGFLIPYYLTKHGYSKAEIGVLFLASAPYFLKPLYAQLFNSFPIRSWVTRMGHSKSWLCVLYAALSLSLGAIFLITFHLSATYVAIILFAVALFTSCVDIVFDGHLIEVSKDGSELSSSITAVKMGFNVGMLIVGTCALSLVGLGMEWVNIFIGLALLEAALATVSIYNLFPVWPARSRSAGNFKEYIITLKDTITGLINIQKSGILFIAFILLYKVSDVVPRAASPMLFSDLSFTAIEISSVSQLYGLLISLFGIYIGGYFVKKFTISKGITIGATIKLMIPISFALLAYFGHYLPMLFVAITAQNLCGGIAGNVLSIYFASLCKKQVNVATSFSILASLGSGSRILLSMLAGIGAHYISWVFFFIVTAVIASMSLVCYKLNQK